ncbi:MAG: Mfa1 family fimbria major subunit [Bacteroidales bacterium]|nr:Mfa1 family fimbria major subunit [Bacteroidales bacterium]
MKTNLFLITLLAAAALLASCKKDNGTAAAVAEEGEATSMTVSVSFPQGLVTRATNDPNATDAETLVNTVDVFIYFTTGALQSHKRLTTFSSSMPDLYESTEKIATTTGPKTVFAGVNLPAAVATALANQTMNALSTAAQTMNRTDLVGAGSLAMFSILPVNSTFVLDESAAANNLELECRRLVAKVTVETAAGMTQGGIPGTLGQLEFAVNNFNTKIFMMQGAAAEHKDPNWATYTAADFNDVNSNADYAEVLSRADNPSPAIGDYSARYAAENTSEGKSRKEITRVTVRATFIPNEITTGTTGNFTTGTHSVTVPQDFWAVTPPASDAAFFFDESTANAFQAEKGGSMVEYTGGYCYWDIFLGKDPANAANKWDVLRNDYYKCNITNIVAPGRNSADIPVADADNTPDVATAIDAEIQVQFWNSALTSNYELE